jgi:ribosomal protein S12 methylthiotransferase accessory factor
MSDPVLAEKLGKLTHPSLGIIRWVIEANLQHDEPPIHIALCEFTNPIKLRPARISDAKWQEGSLQEAGQGLDIRAGALNPVGRKHSTGAGGDRVSAIWATIGEACERYAMHLDDGASAIMVPQDELRSRFVAPSEFILFSQDQYDDFLFAYAPYDPTQPLKWREAVELSTGDSVMVPAQFVSGPLESAEYQILDAMYSTGCAAGASPPHAVASALREAVERDAFMYYWLSQDTPSRIDPAYAAQCVPEWLRPLLSWQGLETHLLLLETDHGIPVICALLLPTGGGGVAIGASCHLDWTVALENAVVEAFHTLNWVIDMDRWDVPSPRENDVRDFNDHVAYYRSRERRDKLSFLTTGDLVRPDRIADLPGTEDHRTHLARMSDALGKVGFEVYVVNLTPSDLASIDVHVARVLVPGLHPLHAGRGGVHLDRRRLEKIAKARGRPLPQILNRDPHPFP